VIIVGNMETITIFQGDRPQLDVRAQQGLWERKENTLTLRSSVEVRDVDGEFWLKSDELIHTEHDSTLTSAGTGRDAVERDGNQGRGGWYMQRKRDCSIFWMV